MRGSEKRELVYRSPRGQRDPLEPVRTLRTPNLARLRGTTSGVQPLQGAKKRGGKEERRGGPPPALIPLSHACKDSEQRRAVDTKHGRPARGSRVSKQAPFHRAETRKNCREGSTMENLQCGGCKSADKRQGRRTATKQSEK